MNVDWASVRECTLSGPLKLNGAYSDLDGSLDAQLGFVASPSCLLACVSGISSCV